MSRLRVDVVTTPEGLASLEPDYARLERVCACTIPFALHEWHVAWWRHFAEATPLTRDALRVHVVRDEDARAVAIVPLVLTQRPGVGAVRAGALTLIGADPNVTELKMPLVDPQHAYAAGRAVARALEEDASWDWIHWEGLSQAGPFEDALSSTPLVRVVEPNPDHVLDLPPTWDELRARSKRNIRESLRHGRNSLKRDGLAFEVEVARAPREIGPALDTFFRLHAARAAATDAVPHPDRFRSSAARAFLVDVADRLARRGRTRVFTMRVGGRAVASRVGFVVGDSLYLYYSGFDPEYGRYGVMTTTVAEAIRSAIDERLRTVNLSPGTDVSKTRWGTRVVPFSSALQVRERRRSRVAHALYRAAANPRCAPPLLQPMLRWLPRRSWA